MAAHGIAIQFVLAQLLPRLHERAPSVRIELRDAGSVRDLSRLGADALLFFGWPPLQPAILRTLAHTRWLVVAAPSFWARHGVPRHPTDLAQLPCVLFRTPQGEVLRQWAFARGSERVEVEVDGWLVTLARIEHRPANIAWHGTRLLTECVAAPLLTGMQSG